MKKVCVLADWSKEGTEETIEEIKKMFGDRATFYPAIAGDCDFALVLGGDGFITRKSLLLAKAKVPFAAINFGTKGFLAVAEKNNWKEVLETILNSRYTVEKRPLLAVTHNSSATGIKSFHAAGNVYIRHKTDMILVSVSIDSVPLYQDMMGDGVIVANVTGATAYNLSAGGALISSGFVVTPICPHALNMRSLPVPEFFKKIEIIYHGRKSNYNRDEGCLLYIDSDKYPIAPQDRVIVEKSLISADFIIPEGFSFIESLQRKLGLSR